MRQQPDPLRFSEALLDVRLSPDGTSSSPVPGATPPGDQASYERGRREGEHALHEQLVRQRAELLALQNGVLASLRQALPQMASECERALVELALAAAHKLVSGLPVSAEMVEASVREALAQAQESAVVHVQLHPEDLELLQRVNSPLLNEGSLEKMKFQSSAEVTRGGCVVQTRFGVIDAQRGKKLELLRESLRT